MELTYRQVVQFNICPLLNAIDQTLKSVNIPPCLEQSRVSSTHLPSTMCSRKSSGIPCKSMLPSTKSTMVSLPSWMGIPRLVWWIMLFILLLPWQQLRETWICHMTCKCDAICSSTTFCSPGFPSSGQSNLECSHQCLYQSRWRLSCHRHSGMLVSSLPQILSGTRLTFHPWGFWS